MFAGFIGEVLFETIYSLVMVRITLCLLAALPVVAQVKITRETGKIQVEIDGKPFTDFYVGAEAPKPYLHPLRSASGKIVTRRWPQEQNTGEATDHPHHQAVRNHCHDVRLERSHRQIGAHREAHHDLLCGRR